MIVSIVDRKQLCSGIAYCIRPSRKCGSEVATRFSGMLPIGLTTDDIDNPRAVLSLSDCLLIQEGAPEIVQHSWPAGKPMMVPSPAGLEAGTQTLEAGITHAEWNPYDKRDCPSTGNGRSFFLLTLSLLLLLFCLFLFPDCSHHCCCICP